MAKFINRQEEVLQIQLTPYGKYMFSQGKLNPSFYAYYDDDILYDGTYGGITETQNEIVDRIKSTNRLELYSNFSGSVRNNQTNSNISANSFDALTEANGKFFRCLGSNSPWSDYAPAWSIQTIDDSVHFSGTEFEYKSAHSIPEIDTTIELEYSGTLSQLILSDGSTQSHASYVSVKNERLLLDVQELNTIFKGGGNYDIEIFKIPDNQSLSITNLNFINPESDAYDLLNQQVEEPSLISFMVPDEELMQIFPRLDPSYVEYFLEVRVDDEISDLPDFRSGLYSANRPNGPQQPCE